MTTPLPVYTGVTRLQAITLVLWGIALWFTALLLTRLIGPLGAFDGLGTVLLYALVIPGTVPFVYLTRLVARLQPGQTAIAIAIVTAAALLCDGIAFAGFRWLYGQETTSAAAAILWGAGVGIVLGLVLNPRR